MLLALILLFVTATFSKPHRTVAKARSNKPLQAADNFEGTICASCEEAGTCGENSTVIDSATVTVDGTETEVTIDSEGTFTLSLPNGEHTIEVTVTCPYQNGTESTETVTSTQTVTIEAEAVPQKATAIFSVQCSTLCAPPAVPVVVQVCVGCNETTGCDEEGTSLVEGRMMALVPVENGTDVPSATIDAEGNATFDAVTPGDYYVHVYDDPYGSSTIEVAGQITVEEDTAEEPETQYFGPLLLENATLCNDPTYIAGRVCADCEAEPPTDENPVNATGTGCTSPLANATVRLTVVSEDGDEVTVEATTDALGNYELEPANVTGNYTIEVLSADCTGSDDEVFAVVTGEINATNETARTEVNISAFCTLRCTANISGIVYVAENDTANYTEGITDPLPGITVDLIAQDTGEVVASVTTSANGTFDFLNVPFGSYLVTAREVPTAGGPTGEGCELSYDDISLPVDVETNTTYNVSIVRAQECNNASLCGQILFAANYCTDANSTDNSTQPIAIFLNTSNCNCTNSSIMPGPPFRPCPGRPFPPPPPPPPPPYYGNTSIDTLWRAFLLGTNYPTLAAQVESSDEAGEDTAEAAPQLTNSKRVLKNQRLIPSRCPPPCPHCPHCSPCPPIPPFPQPTSNTTCSCAANGTFQGCFEVLAPMPTAVARLYRVAAEGEEEETPQYQMVAETEVLPNGSFCFRGLPEGDNYVLEVVVSENDTLDLAASNISEAIGPITSTVVLQEGAYPPTQQVVAFGPMTLTGDEAGAVPPFTAVFTNDALAAEATVRISNVTFEPLPDNTTNTTVPDNSTDEVIPTQIRYLDPFGASYMYPLSSSPKRTSNQIVTPSAKKAVKKPKSTVLRQQAAQEPSTVKVLRPQSAPAAAPKKPAKTTKPAASATVRRPPAKPASSTTTKTSKQTHGTKTTRTKTVTTKNGSTSTTTVTRRN